MRKQNKKRSCAVCGRGGDVPLAPFRDVAMLCPIHDAVARGIIPSPASIEELRALFPARVTVPRRARPPRAA